MCTHNNFVTCWENKARDNIKASSFFLPSGDLSALMLRGSKESDKIFRILIRRKQEQNTVARAYHSSYLGGLNRRTVRPRLA